MKILQVIPYFPPSYAFGGSLKVAYQISKELVKRGHEVVVYTTDAENLDSRLNVEPVKVVDGIKVHYMKNLSLMLVKWSKLFITTDIGLRAKEEIKEFDIVHLHEYRSYQNIIIHRYAKKYGVPYVLQAHGSLPRTMAKRWLKRIYDALFGYRLLRDASRVVALSRVEAEQYKSMGVSDEKIAIIPDGIDLSEYVDLPPKGSFKKKFGIDSDKKMILYLGRIHKIKGIDFLVRAYACLLKSMKDDNAILVLAGSDDGYLAGAKRLVASLKIADKVVFTGMLTEKEKVSAYVDSSIVVNVEPINVFGLVPLEAAACATPVIVSNTNAISEIIDGGRFGFSVNYGDVNELARVMGKMLDNDDLSRKMGQNGRDFVSKKFSWNRIITSFEKVYKDAIEN